MGTVAGFKLFFRFTRSERSSPEKSFFDPIAAILFRRLVSGQCGHLHGSQRDPDGDAVLPDGDRTQAVAGQLWHHADGRAIAVVAVPVDGRMGSRSGR